MSSRGTMVAPEAKEWNEYWNQKNIGGSLYGAIAEFYRKVLIRPNLNRYIRKHFGKDAKILHAGCGSGQVDRDIANEFTITGLDISERALEIYKSENPRCSTTLASILDTKIPSGTYDGIYNLGVMEHFNQNDIRSILCEFKRILKPGGKIVLFWPPEFGVSVIFFKVLRALCRLFLRRDVKFHPDEISRIESYSKVKGLIESEGFKLIDYSFGWRDAFTYSIVCAQKLK